MFNKSKSKNFKINYNINNGCLEWKNPSQEKSKNLILIYSMGKVGSTSIYDSIKGSVDKNISVIKLEGFSDNRINRSVDVKFCPRSTVNMLKDADNIIGKRDSIQANFSDKSKKLFVITGFREPISCSISAFFQNMHYFFPLGEEILTDTPEKSFSILKDLYFEMLQKSIDGYSVQGNIYANLFIPFLTSCVNFFEQEMEQTLGIDIYSYEFDKKKKHMVLNLPSSNKLAKNAQIMLYDVQKLNKLNIELNSFLGSCLNKEIELKNSNTAQDKNYNRIYKYFLENIKMPSYFTDYFLNSKYVKHFYDSEDIDRLYNKYTSS